MTIDNFYTKTDKSYFYLGMISQVYRDNSIVQVENLSWLSHRKIKLETLIPNTINYFIVIDTTQGLFIGEVFQSKVSNSDSVHDSMNKGITEDVYPEVSIDVIGVMKHGEQNFKLAGFQTVGITDKVYIANSDIMKIYIDSIEINKDSEETDLSFAKFSNIESQKISLNASTLFDRHLMVIGTTNSGKSTSALSILDKLIKSKKKVLIIDPTGEYRDSFKEEEITKLKLGANTVLSVGEVQMQQWAMLFEVNDGTQPAVLSNAIKSLRYQKKVGLNGIYKKVGKKREDVDREMANITSSDKDFILNNLPEQIAAETHQIDNSNKYIFSNFNFNANQWLVEKVLNKLNNSSFTSFFSNDSTKKNLIKELDNFATTEATSLSIDTSEIGTTDSIGGMIIDLLSNNLVNKKNKAIKPFVMFVDEAHRYTKPVSYELDYYTGLTTIAREGRKKGIFLFLTTQSPQDVSTVLLGQMGTLLIHRLTYLEDLKAIQNHFKGNVIGQIKKLNQGEAILTSINLLQDIHLKIDKCERIHICDTPKL